MIDVATLASRLRDRFAGQLQELDVSFDEVTVVVNREDILGFGQLLRDEPGFEFKQLIDVSAVDYLAYGQAEWTTDAATATGFDRGVVKEQWQLPEGQARFAIVYHLLSITNNQRLRIKVFLDEEDLRIHSVNSVWPAANWFEREVFDMFGIAFENHPDLRRILTDYGFVGHPFRKDFPVSGYVEVRYDAKQQRVLYEPVEIEPRVLVPKVIRHDNRYSRGNDEEQKNG